MSHKIALISDIHFGCRNNSEQYLEMIRSFFINTLNKVLIDRKITDVRILGDLFDCRNNINVRTLNVVLEVFEWFEINNPNIVFTIFPGNHDVYYKNKNDVNSMKVLKNHKNIVLHEKIHIETLHGKRVISVPWLVDDTEDEMKFKKICESETEKFDLCLGHFEIQGFEINKGQFDEFGKSQGIFKNFSRVFSGHYHIRNTLGRISYLGCPYQLTWGDYEDKKGIHIYDLDTNTTEFIENVDSPIHVKITIDDILKKNLPVLKKIKGNYVKLIIDKKVSDTFLVQAQSKIESLSPLKFDIENTVIEVIEEKNGIDISKTNDPISFLIEYVDNIEIEEGIEKNDLKKYLSEIYQSSLT
jgi:DNA repair exonuclease SbcCD nuclease subunit